MLKAWSHKWYGPAAGESSSAPSVPGPGAHCACSTKRHSEKDLKGEGSGRGRPDPEAPKQIYNGPQETVKMPEEAALWTHSLTRRSEKDRTYAGRDQD